ncbi:MAG: PaaI family thioesterase [Bacteroidales bacterium]|nr:PaaI family thioesterase [Bacteroidales bacterium]
MSKQINNPFRGKKGYNCFGCSPDNPIGLQMHFRIEDDIVTSDWTPGNHYQGWMNVLHGGIQATLMDEIASWLVMVKLKTAGVTSKMEVRLLKTAQMDHAPFRLVARLEEMNKNIALVKVELFDRDQQLCADALMHYFTWPEHIARERMHYPGIEGFIK